MKEELDPQLYLINPPIIIERSTPPPNFDI